MNKNIFTSINRICEELDSLGMHKESTSLTDVMVKLANKSQIFEKAVVRKLGEKIVVEFTNNYWDYRRSQRDFESIEEARKYARSKAHKVEVYD